MKRLIIITVIIIVCFFLGKLITISSEAQQNNCPPSCSDGTPGSPCQTEFNQCIGTINQELQQSEAATAPAIAQLNSLEQQITGIKTNLGNIQNDLLVKQQDIASQEKHLANQKIVLSHAVADFYIRSYEQTPLLVLISGASASQVTQILAYQKAAENQDKNIITNIVLEIRKLNEEKKADEAEQINLTSLETKLNTQTAQLNTLIQGAQSYQASLSSQISQLTAQQQQLIAQKLASLNIPLTAYAGLGGGCSSDLTNGTNPGFDPRFAAFTYGVPDRVGMNQYGAMGRAMAGQSYQDILNAYYANFQFTTVSPSTNITVNGTNDYGEPFNNQSMGLDDYVDHLYEMPTTGNWTANNGAALEAQAITARTYAMYATNNGQNSIIPNQHGQEVKQEINDSTWQQAVSNTSGIIMTSNGAPIAAWYSSTFGGYEFTSSDIGWSSTPWTKEMMDTSGSVNNFSDLSNNSYDGPNHGNSPWFYCDWGSRSQYDGTAWLQPNELADIVNVILLAQADSSTIPHLSQVDKPNPNGVDTWSASQVQQQLQSRGKYAYSTITSVNVSFNAQIGKTTSVTVSDGSQSTTIDGTQFENFFDLRAPANIQIVGPLYNIESQ